MAPAHALLYGYCHSCKILHLIQTQFSGLSFGVTFSHFQQLLCHFLKSHNWHEGQSSVNKATRQNNKKTRKNKKLEKLFRENKSSPLLKTPEKDFQTNFLMPNWCQEQD